MANTPKTPKTQQILNLSIETVNKMSVADLKKNVQILASAANKRLARLGSTEIGQISPAYISAMKRSYTGSAGGKFGTAGKSRNQLLNEYKAIKSFMSLKTSSVSSWRKVREASYKQAGIEPTDDPEKEKAFWAAYRKIESMYPNMKSKGYDSATLKSDLRKVMNGQSAKMIIDDVNRYNLHNRDFVITEDGDAIQTSKLRKLDGSYIVDDVGRIFEVNINDPEDVLKIMELKINKEYEINERQQRNESDDEEFFEL